MSTFIWRPSAPMIVVSAGQFGLNMRAAWFQQIMRVIANDYFVPTKALPSDGPAPDA